MTYVREVSNLLGEENYSKIIRDAKSGNFTEQKLTDLAQLLGRHESEPNRVYGNHQRRMETYRNRESHSEVQSILSDWWCQQGYGMDQSEAVGLLQKSLKEIDLKPLASNLVTPNDSTMIVINEQPTRTRTWSRSRKASRTRSNSRTRSRPTSRWRNNIGRSCTVVSGLCRCCAMLLVSSSSATFRFCSEKFQTLSKAQKLILLSVVSVTLYIYHLCGLAHSIAPSGTRFLLR